MNKFAVIDDEGMVCKRSTVIPLTIHEGRRISVLYDGPPIYMATSLGNVSFIVGSCECQISSHEAYIKGEDTKYFHKFSILGASLDDVVKAIELCETLIGIKKCKLVKMGKKVILLV